jgi:hypothetical protein
MIIPMLEVDPKLPETALAHCSFISHLYRVDLCFTSYFSLHDITQTLVHPRLESMVALSIPL